MTYDQAMESPDREKWKIAIEKEHEKMTTNNVWKPVSINDVGNDATILSSKWVANGVLKARLTAREVEQRDGEHYDEHCWRVYRMVIWMKDRHPTHRQPNNNMLSLLS
jgi:hypothetical protein